MAVAMMAGAAAVLLVTLGKAVWGLAGAVLTAVDNLVAVDQQATASEIEFAKLAARLRDVPDGMPATYEAQIRQLVEWFELPSPPPKTRCTAWVECPACHQRVPIILDEGRTWRVIGPDQHEVHNHQASGGINELPWPEVNRCSSKLTTTEGRR